MATSVRHRGPDDEGYVALSGAGDSVQMGGPETAAGCLPADAVSFPAARLELHDVVLGARRLAILDLSPGGHQPMASPDGRAWIVHNGEIYNYRELRQELRAHGHEFRGGSDTEVALAAYREWGTQCFARFNGMWGIAIWDQVRRTLVLSRDRFGVKPLYVAASGEGIIFASEIKALIVAGVQARPNPVPLRRYLETGRIDVSRSSTCFLGIEQVEPGTFLEYRSGSAPRATRYYDVAEAGGEELRATTSGELLELLDDAVRLRLRSDVPVGSCLSGGLDSSSVVALAVAQLPSGGAGFRTFTFSAGTSSLDESHHARAVVEHVGAEPAFVAALDVDEQFEAAVREQEEPIGSGSVVAQRAVMSLAHQSGAKVLLDGQGGDEVLAGYGYYAGARLADLAASLRLGDWFREWRAATGTLAGRRWLARATIGELRSHPLRGNRLAEEQREDVRMHLPALLHYEDRNSMAFSIETRLPFLDYRVVELGLSLPGAAKLAGGWTKLALRRAVDGRLPPGIVWRRDKIQFAVPQTEWLRGPLREHARELLLDGSFDGRPVADAAAASALMRDVDQLDRPRADRLWRMLALEAWYREHVDRAGPAAVRPVSLAS
jgi:asparagine synthase (glutamine-hydrolysing)